MKMRFLTILLLLAVFVFISCDGSSMEKLWKDELGNGSGSGSDPTPPPVPGTYTVSFDMKGYGTQIDPITGVESGAKITKPADPAADGFKFGGWYKEAGCANAWDFANDTVTEDVTLYAKWTVNTYTVTFNANGHGTAPASITDVAHGSKITAPTAPTEAGYAFGGWYKEEAFTNAWDFASDTVTENTTLYAKWTQSLPPEGALPGGFSVSPTKKVHFSKGNLQAVFSGAAKTWKFADNQYDYVGAKAANTTINGNGSVSAAGTVDLFGWSTSKTIYGIHNSDENETYSGAFVDWCNIETLPGNSNTTTVWQTLSKDEWDYLINTRVMTNNKPSYSNAVAGVYIGGSPYRGIFLYPDDYSGDVVSGSMTWGEINAAGIVFLPAAGCRDGSGVGSVIYLGDEGEYGDYAGAYWSSTLDGDLGAYILRFSGRSVYTASFDRQLGCCVRLVWQVEN